MATYREILRPPKRVQDVQANSKGKRGREGME